MSSYGPISLLLILGLILPNIAVSVRRLHDIDRSGWWILLPALPYCLAFVLGGAPIPGGAASASAMGTGAGMGIAAISFSLGRPARSFFEFSIAWPERRGTIAMVRTLMVAAEAPSQPNKDR